METAFNAVYPSMWCYKTCWYTKHGFLHSQLQNICKLIGKNKPTHIPRRHVPHSLSSLETKPIHFHTSFTLVLLSKQSPMIDIDCMSSGKRITCLAFLSSQAGSQSASSGSSSISICKTVSSVACTGGNDEAFTCTR